jgi:predicted transcriptional regulator
MAITLKPETEEKLRQVAQRQGQDAHSLADIWLAESIARHEQEFEANVAAIQEGLDAIDQGRVRPFEDFLSEHRQRYPDAGLES